MEEEEREESCADLRVSRSLRLSASLQARARRQDGGFTSRQMRACMLAQDSGRFAAVFLRLSPLRSLHGPSVTRQPRAPDREGARSRGRPVRLRISTAVGGPRASPSIFRSCRSLPSHSCANVIPVRKSGLSESLGSRAHVQACEKAREQRNGRAPLGCALCCLAQTARTDEACATDLSLSPGWSSSTLLARPNRWRSNRRHGGMCIRNSPRRRAL